MRFRQYLGAEKLPSRITFAEADLLGKPSTGASTTPAPQSSPEPGHEQLDRDSPAHGAGRPPGQLDDQMKLAAVIAGDLRKLLASLPNPWNKQFYLYLQPLQALMAKLQDLS